MKYAILTIIVLAIYLAQSGVSLPSMNLEFGHFAAMSGLYLLGMVTAGPAVAQEPSIRKL